MSYRPEYLAACARVARDHRLDDHAATLLAVAGPAAFAGQVPAQVPEPDAAAAVHMGWLQDLAGHDAGLAGRLVEEGWLAWKTSRGWSHDPEGRHPVTGRAQPSRQLWVTARTVGEIGPALHDLFVEGLGNVRRKSETGPALLREGYRARYEEGMALGRDGFIERLAAMAAPDAEVGAALAP